jgi:hypothetical protein
MTSALFFSQSLTKFNERSVRHQIAKGERTAVEIAKEATEKK